MITHDEALKDFNTLVGGEELKEIIEYPPNGNWHKLYSNVIAYLQRAKKVEVLLELYRKQSNLLWDEDFVSATPVKWEIDDLEKALEEKMK